MRNALVYLLLVATLLPTFSQWGIIAHYQINKEYIARVLCENRDKPQLHCDGKCYLAKRLRASQDRQDKETTERVRATPTITLFCTDQFAFDFASVVANRSTDSVPDYLLKPYATTTLALLRPPRA